jgi:hypothetical protein
MNYTSLFFVLLTGILVGVPLSLWLSVHLAAWRISENREKLDTFVSGYTATRGQPPPPPELSLFEEPSTETGMEAWLLKRDAEIAELRRRAELRDRVLERLRSQGKIPNLVGEQGGFIGVPVPPPPPPLRVVE